MYEFWNRYMYYICYDFVYYLRYFWDLGLLVIKKYMYELLVKILILEIFFVI